MNDVDKIYETFGKNFCICPFLGAFYQTNRVIPNAFKDDPTWSSNTVVPCSVIEWIDKPGAPTVVDNSIISTVNKPVWRELRKSLANGRLKETKSCDICNNAERLGGSSPRIGANRHFVHQLKDTDIISEVQKIIDNNYYVTDIYSLDWFPSNYCNYSCVMCAGGASSGRLTYEIKVLKKDDKITINSVDSDFYDVLKKVEVINFTGGETLMQPQVHDLMRYMVENNIAANKTLFFLTNGSSSLEDLLDLYSNFRRIIYMCSLDGVGDVIEYQRRGSVWNTVEKNALEVFRHPKISSIGNFVLTSMNALNVVDFVKWLHDNQVQNGVTVSSVYREHHLSVDSLPIPLRQLAIDRIRAAYNLYPNYQKFMDMVLSNLEGANYNPDYHRKFCEQINNEDTVSNKSFCSVVPEWVDFWLTNDK